MAGRGTDIILGGNPAAVAKDMLKDNIPQLAQAIAYLAAALVQPYFFGFLWPVVLDLLYHPGPASLDLPYPLPGALYRRQPPGHHPGLRRRPHLRRPVPQLRPCHPGPPAAAPHPHRRPAAGPGAEILERLNLEGRAGIIKGSGKKEDPPCSFPLLPFSPLTLAF